MGWTSKNIVMDGVTMIDKRTGEVLDPEVYSTLLERQILSRFL